MDVRENSLPAAQQFRRRSSAWQTPPTAFDQKFFGFMISASGVAKNERVLDVACGAGSATMAFAERCARAVGIDVIADPLRRARAIAAERKIPNADFVLSEIERLPFRSGFFDGAFCRFSFHHIVHPHRVFAEMARVVASGGWMLVADMVAPENSAEAELHNQMERLCDPTHQQALPISEFERMAAKHGFRIAMKVARDSRITLDDWIRFGSAAPEDAARLRTMVDRALADGTSSRFTRDGDVIRVTHNSVSFVLEDER
jgi:ubiquinone/menaquinone biosynthesis C-methylase UbiE